MRDLLRRVRGAGGAQGNEATGVTDRVVNQLLTFLYGVEQRKNVLDLIDRTLLRPSRFDKKLLCALPDAHERADIVRRFLCAVRFARRAPSPQKQCSPDGRGT